MNMDTQAGREAYSNIAGQFVREWSVGFNLPSNDSVAFDRDGKETVRHILDLDWVEVSSVVRGASPATMTIGAKSDDMVTTTPEAPEEVPAEAETEPEELETEPGADQPDEPNPPAPDTDVQAASGTVQERLRLLRLRLRLNGIKTN